MRPSPENMAALHDLSQLPAGAVREEKPRSLLGPLFGLGCFPCPPRSFCILTVITKLIGFGTGMLVLPQRQSFLVAR
jgi:hypothetical protein